MGALYLFHTAVAAKQCGPCFRGNTDTFFLDYLAKQLDGNSIIQIPTDRDSLVLFTRSQAHLAAI